jgi:hypothetical protein
MVGEDGVVGGVSQRLVEERVERRQFVSATSLGRGETFGRDTTKLGELLIGATLGGELGHQSLESQTHDEEVVGLLARERGDAGAAPRFDFHESFDGKEMEGLAYRCARHVELGGQIFFHESLTGGVETGDDGLANGFQDHRGQGLVQGPDFCGSGA